MASNIVQNAGITEDLFPLSVTIDGNQRNVIVKQSAVPYISDNYDKFIRALTTFLTENPSPYTTYISDPENLIKTRDINMNIQVPEKPECFDIKPKPKPTAQRSESPKPSTSTATDDYNQPNYNEMESESDDDTEKRGRLEWGLYKSRKRLSIYKEKAHSLYSTKNKKRVWEQIATALSTDSTFKVTADQARERFYTLKRGYRKYLSESKQTGNKRPKVFILETEMADILQDDPTFSPPCTRGSLPSNDVVEEEGEKDEAKTPPSKKKKKHLDEIKDILKETDERLLSSLQEMQNKQNELLQKHIDKLSL